MQTHRLIFHANPVSNRTVRPLALLVLLSLALFGCANRGAPTPDTSVIARVDETDQKDWFCSPGTDPDSWDCQRGEPDTIRRPPSRDEIKFDETGGSESQPPGLSLIHI